MTRATDPDYEFETTKNKYWESAEYCQRAQFLNRPSIKMNVHIYKDGNKWCAAQFPPSQVNMMEQLVAFGDTPEEACQNFDHVWITGKEPS